MILWWFSSHSNPKSPQNHPYCGWGSSTKWRCRPSFGDHFLHSLVEHVDSQLAIVIGCSWCSLKASTHSSYTATMNNQSGALKCKKSEKGEWPLHFLWYLSVTYNSYLHCAKTFDYRSTFLPNKGQIGCLNIIEH